MGCYLAQDNASTTEHVVGAMAQCPREVALMVVGDLNAKIMDPEGNRRYETIAAAL